MFLSDLQCKDIINLNDGKNLGKIVDIELNNFTLDPNKIEEAITDKTVAIIPVHVFGYACDIDADCRKTYNANYGLMPDSDITIIRPLIYAGEQRIQNLAEKLQVPVVENPCPQDRSSKRYEIKQLMKTMCAEYPDMKSKIFGAMQRYPLPNWAPKEKNRK